jgi:CO/xanthine dehydrogenase Mo-binding subunit
MWGDNNMTTKKVIGQPIPRLDGPEKITGKALYGIDAKLPGMLWMKVLRSPFPHARIKNIDTSAAESMAGVSLVLTGEDLKGKLTGNVIKDQPLLCWDEVRLVGDCVAAVVAVDEDTAQEAVALIDVEYEELPAIINPEEAHQNDAPILHPDYNNYVGAPPMDAPGNRYGGLSHERGDVQKGFDEADIVIENTYKTPLIHPGYLEPHGCLIYIDDEGIVQVWNNNDTPNGAHQELARVFDLDPDNINFNVNYVGGSFGGKSSGVMVGLTYAAAEKTGLPVKWSSDYDEEFQNMTMRHPAIMRVKAGVKNDGTITAWESEIHLAGGAYAGYAPIPAMAGILTIVGPYDIEHIRVNSHQMYTNTSPCTFVRSPGHVQAHFAGESHMDVLAKAVGMDPLEFRLHNIVKDGDEYPTGDDWQNVRAEEALRQAAESAGYYKEKAENVGRGIAIGSHSQIGATAHVVMKVLNTGRVEINHPLFDGGVGTATILAQIAAEELDIPTDYIDIVPWSTREGKTADMGVGGSRGARVYSEAGFGASQELKGNLKRLAAEFNGWDEDQIIFEDAHLVNGANTAEKISLGDIADRVGEPVSGRTDEEQGFDSPWTGFGVHIVDVSVDPETAETTVLNYTAVQETGRILNPLGWQSQVEGGIVQSIGSAMMEGLFFDESGRVSNPSFADMKLPTSKDVPPLQTVALESDDGHGHYKVRGIGEHTNAMAAPAIANAIADAVDARLYSMPLTSENLYNTLKTK